MDKITLKQNCEAIAAELQDEGSTTNMDLLCEKALRINALIGLSAECMAQARKDLLYRQAQLLKIHQSDKMPPSVLIKFVQSECWEESATEVWVDRLNAGLTHAQEVIRTIVSLRKTEMALTMQG